MSNFVGDDIYLGHDCSVWAGGCKNGAWRLPISLNLDGPISSHAHMSIEAARALAAQLIAAADHAEGKA